MSHGEDNNWLTWPKRGFVHAKRMIGKLLFAIYGLPGIILTTWHKGGQAVRAYCQPITIVMASALTVAGTGAALAAPDVKAGVDAWARGDFKTAVEQWRPAALAGDADAQFNLAQAYKLGRGVAVDLRLAEEWYRRAALQGHLQAVDNYGLALFQNGKQADAVPWLEKSAARGEPRAQLVLGTMLFNGDNVTKDWVRAYALLVRSSAAGLPQGSQTLAQMDQYIPLDTRQKGIALARQYEADAQRAQAAPELAGGAHLAIKQTELPGSAAANDSAKLKPVVNGAHKPATLPPPKAPAAAGRSAASNAATTIAGRGWRVQFGAFRDRTNAERLWQALNAKVAALGALRPYYVKSGTVIRLQAGPLTSSIEASRLCANVRARMADTACLAVAPQG